MPYRKFTVAIGVRNQLKFEVVVWLRKTEAFAELRNKVLDLAGEDPVESTEYEGMVDFHWRFERLAEAERVANALRVLCDRPELIVLRLSNFANLDASITFKDARRVTH